MGAMGQLSRVLNPVLTPITHAALPSRAAPGQLTAQEVMQARSLIGLLPPQKFWLFGSPIAASVSPTLHNTGFGVLGFPHEYGRCEAATITDAVKETLADPAFGGASVTIPLKLDIMPLLNEVSEHARTIGAVNTVIVRTGEDGQRELHGDNTDWMAIEEAARANLNPALAAGKDGLTTLVIGAGGTCRAAIYALHALGSRRIILFNRTLANAEKVAASFPAEYGIVVADDLAKLPAAPAVVVSTVPGASLTTEQGGEGIYLPPSVLTAKGGVAIDMAYKPHQTALLQAAEKAGWAPVTGIEILCLQGFRQFTLWTGKPAPKHAMRKAAMEQYFSS
jgi:pentafunctional AROM polypeptide